LEPGFDGLVLVNGGVVEMGGTPIYEERMGYDLARATVDFLVRHGFEYQIVTADDIYTLRSHTEIRRFFDDIGHEDFFVYDFDLDEVLSAAIKMETIVPREDRARVTAEVAEELGSAIACDGHGGEGTFELYPTAISKAKGIEVALGRLGLGAKDAYAFGDGTNDLEMIAYCGCGVAMGNAEDVVKEAADIVCAPVWDDGLAQILAELF
jgi:HAD superfamily hydrolase (TIGR01484 family)